MHTVTDISGNEPSSEWHAEIARRCLAAAHRDLSPWGFTPDQNIAWAQVHALLSVAAALRERGGHD